ncbi:hypothetical protein HYU94_03045 [Candidatus Daviesbacteria bacterium]|nr:hypothetical protein [Candidatus Daviesbacteria bacterium]
MKISINLLPPVTVILLLVFLTSLTLALRILQSNNIVLSQVKLTKAEEKVSGLKNTQASLFLLKNRLTTIKEYFGVPSKQSSIYQLIEKLIPESVITNAITVDKSGEVVFSALIPDSVSLDLLINSLTGKESNEGKIEEISIESLNRGRDGAYRVGFKIKPKKQ